MGALTYSEAGVNRLEADRFVERIALLSKSTLNRKVKAAVGGYASLYELDRKRLLAASTDGVGTKLKLAFKLNQHRTVGIDLVAMSVNDLLCVGAEPLFFLDYFATGRLVPGVSDQVLEGIVAGCKEAGCALVGGETAEMPDFYTPGEYDLAGFAVGLVDAKALLPKKDICPGDILIGIRSSGCHSNGFSLIRRVLEQNENGRSLTEELLTPTRIYAKALLPLIHSKLIKGLAHITGSGFLNVPRISDKVSYEINLPPMSERPSIYSWIYEKTKLPFEELAQTFNLGVGMVAVVSPRHAEKVIKRLARSAEQAWEIGKVIPRKSQEPSTVILRDGGNSAVLKY